MSQIAPVLLFTYKRLDTLKETVGKLKDNQLADESELYVFSDAAKYEKDRETINEIRAFIKTIKGFKSVYIYEAETNMGLAKSIINGVSKVFEKHDQLIVLEDDLSTSPNFLSFMNAALMKYKNEKNAFSVSGYSFNLGSASQKNDDDAYFLNRGWSWGWATWKDRWLQIDWEVKDYSTFSGDQVLRRDFAKGGSDLNSMLDKQMKGELDSWAIRWFYWQFKCKGLTLYPKTSKVFNNGFDKDATHTNGAVRRYLPLFDSEGKIDFRLPSVVEVDAYYQRRFSEKMGIRARILSKLETLFLKIFR